MRENRNRSIQGIRVESREISERFLSFETLKRQPRLLLRKFQVIRCAITHPEVPWYARLVAILSVCYVFSPIQLIPSFIPVIGQLDDALVITLGFKALTRWVPAGLLAQWSDKPQGRDCSNRPSVHSVRFLADSLANPYRDAAPENNL